MERVVVYALKRSITRMQFIKIILNLPITKAGEVYDTTTNV